ncbi:MAG: hypothetical protein PHS33_07675 [Candidatus Omnitrophica bacterium]|nr:hypothetical protein [Candidatus Omnitrophota bacterium]
MKKLFAVIFMLVFVTGCTGLNTTVAVNVATDTAFVLALQNNPSYKAPVIDALNKIKTFLNGKVTYDDLILEISKQFPDKYAVIAVVLTGYIETDKPVFETYLSMLDSYKSDVIKKIDRLILLANV